MTQFDEIIQTGDDPVRHHTFYFDDGNVVLNVSKLYPRGMILTILRRFRACFSGYTSTSSLGIQSSSKTFFG